MALLNREALILALYAIGDLHLSFGSDKPMDVFGGGWVSYLDKIKKGFQVIKPEDICVICGDISWGMSLEESLEDFLFIESLPGKKIIIKGNHDYWWTTVTKMSAFFEANGIGSISILHNNCFYYGTAAICGTRGWLADDELSAEQNGKIMEREISRLRVSLQSAADTAIKLCFLHYPPCLKNSVCHELVALMNEYGVICCRYGHLHGDGHRLAVRGTVGSIEYEIVSADFVDFTPQRVMFENKLIG